MATPDGHQIPPIEMDGPTAPAEDTKRPVVDGDLVFRYSNRQSPWGKILRWMGILLVIAAVAHEAVGTYYDRKLTNVIREASGRQDLEVHCRRVWDEVLNIRANPGFVEWGSTAANLQFPVCMDAAAWSGDPYDEDKQVALMVLTHELAHLVGHFDEAETECVAMWAVPQVAVSFGGSFEDGEATARWYAAEYNPRLRADYLAPGCLSGPKPRSGLLR